MDPLVIINEENGEPGRINDFKHLVFAVVSIVLYTVRGAAFFEIYLAGILQIIKQTEIHSVLCMF
jgi:hypothetical protein